MDFLAKEVVPGPVFIKSKNKASLG